MDFLRDYFCFLCRVILCRVALAILGFHVYLDFPSSLFVWHCDCDNFLYDPNASALILQTHFHNLVITFIPATSIVLLN